MHVRFATPELSSETDLYPVRDTTHDTMELYEEETDRGMVQLQLCARVLALSARKLADEPLLPHDFLAVAHAMGRGLHALRADQRYQEVALHASTGNQNVTLDYLEEAVEYFEEAAANWTDRSDRVNLRDPLAVRAFNDQVMSVERAFLMEDRHSSSLGIVGGGVRNLVFGPARFRDMDTIVPFPGVLEIVNELEPGLLNEVQLQRWEALRRHLSDLMIAVRQAAEIMWDFQFI